ncbi:MAG: hypothetical protein ACREM2_01345 [Vulcanimicrobiaceae bacterium]
MAQAPNAAAAPPVEIVLGELVASLVTVAHAYLEAQEGRAPDLEAAKLALDVAGDAYGRLEPRLSAEERSGLGRLLSTTRLVYVRKRGA